MSQHVTIHIYGHPLPAQRVTLDDGTPGIEIEGVAFPHVTDEVPNGIRALSDDQTKKMAELRQRLKITSEAGVLPFEFQTP